jgi:hypothetical protein
LIIITADIVSGVLIDDLVGCPHVLLLDQLGLVYGWRLQPLVTATKHLLGVVHLLLLLVVRERLGLAEVDAGVALSLIIAANVLKATILLGDEPWHIAAVRCVLWETHQIRWRLLR